jgi:hypothetical protein
MEAAWRAAEEEKEERKESSGGGRTVGDEKEEVGARRRRCSRHCRRDYADEGRAACPGDGGTGPDRMTQQVRRRPAHHLPARLHFLLTAT